MDKLIKEMAEVEKKNFIIVVSSSGTVIASRETGNVLSVELDDEEDESCYLLDIAKFDLDEWRSYWCIRELHEEFDILDLTYWTKSNEYEEAEATWRLRRFCDAEEAIQFCFKKQDSHGVYHKMIKAYLDMEDHEMVVELENELQRYLLANYK